MIQTYKKGSATVLRKLRQFTSSDFDCKCPRLDCIATLIDDDLILGLRTLWEVAGPFKVNCGYRCKGHNKEVGGAPRSCHVLGKAADVSSLKGYSGYSMANYAEAVPAFERSGIGIYLHFVHVDTRGEKARWSFLTKC